MKKYHLGKAKKFFRASFLTLVVFLTVCPAWAADPGGDAEARVQNLRSQLQRIRDEMRGDGVFNSGDPKVIIVGPSRAGKSTLINYLAGKTVQSHLAPIGFRLDVLDPLPGSRVAPGPEAVTITPAPKKLGDSVYIDCPGFYDAAGPEQKITNTFSIHYLFANDAPKKVVLAIPETDLSADAAPILPLLRKMTETFPGDQLQRILSMVITKQRNINDPSAILRDLSARDPTRVVDLTPSVKNLLIYLADNCERLVSYLPRQRKLDLTTLPVQEQMFLERLEMQAF